MKWWIQLGICTLLLYAFAACQSNSGGSSAGATFTSPYHRSIAHAQCMLDAQHHALLGFPTLNEHTAEFYVQIGGQTNLSPTFAPTYHGAGTYHVLMIFRDAQEHVMVGPGSVSVDPQLHSGSFHIDEGDIMGVWQCDKPLDP